MNTTWTLVQPQVVPALLSGALVTVYFLSRLFLSTRTSRRPDWKAGKPTVGTRNQWFSWERATLRSFSLSKSWSLEGYAKVSLGIPSRHIPQPLSKRQTLIYIACGQFGKANSPFIMPCVERGPVVIVPPKQIKSVYSLRDEVIDMYNTSTNDSMQARYTISDKQIVTHPFQMGVIRNQMTRNLEVLTPVIAAELEWGFQRVWGTGKEWKEVRIWDSCLDLIGGASNAAFCGAPLCKIYSITPVSESFSRLIHPLVGRNVAFLGSLRDHGMITFLGALMISATPRFLRPITGTLIGWACEFAFLRAKWLCMPFIKERLANTARAIKDPGFCWTAPVSYCLPIHQADYELITLFLGPERRPAVAYRRKLCDQRCDRA